MSEKWTQGPWFAPSANIAKYGFPRWGVGFQDGDRLGCIAKVQRVGTPDERQANAHLIVAAPNMAEALADLLYAVEGESEAVRRRLVDEITAARAALSKARGES